MESFFRNLGEGIFIRGYGYINESAFLVVVVVVVVVVLPLIITIILDHTVTKVERNLLGPSVRMGGLGFTDPVVTSSSIKVTNLLVRRIV